MPFKPISRWSRRNEHPHVPCTGANIETLADDRGHRAGQTEHVSHRHELRFSHRIRLAERMQNGKFRLGLQSFSACLLDRQALWRASPLPEVSRSKDGLDRPGRCKSW